ncbi:MAG TPA: ribonuclease III [Bacteroidota bacterium]|nr:ribonuclease III [Bacteroidota bacterium]
MFSEALAHRSYLQISNNESVLSNERLEFLGDAVLNLVIAEFLFQTRTDAHEGDLTKIRSRLVNRKALSVYARDMQLGNFILMSPSTAQMEGKGMDTILADAFEAIIGAIYLDGGFLAAKRFIERHVSTALQKGVVRIEDENFKSQLLERTQSQGLGTPRYMTVSQDGPDHDRTFTIEVIVGNVAYGKGVGKNKKDAEQAAAEQTLQMLPEPPRNEA